MEHKNFIICDSEEDYAIRLMDYLAARPELYVQVRAFTSSGEAAEFAGQNPVAVLLMDESFPPEERDKIAADNVFVLAGDGRVSVGSREQMLYKYRPARALLDHILEACLDRQDNSVFRRIRKKNRRLVAVYSPAPCTEQTRKAVALGKCLAENANVLYLNLQEYAGWEAVTEIRQEHSLEDLIYYVRQGDENLGIRAGAMAGQLEQLAYLEPMKVSRDVKDVTWEEWSTLLTQILEESMFETVIVEPGESMQGLWEFLGWCQEIYVYTVKGDMGEAKLAQFEENLRLLGKEEIIKRMKREEMDTVSGRQEA